MSSTTRTTTPRNARPHSKNWTEVNSLKVIIDAYAFIEAIASATCPTILQTVALPAANRFGISVFIALVKYDIEIGQNDVESG